MKESIVRGVVSWEGGVKFRDIPRFLASCTTPYFACFLEGSQDAGHVIVKLVDIQIRHARSIC